MSVDGAANLLREVRAQIPTVGRLPTAPPALHHELRVMVATKGKCMKYDLEFDKQCKIIERETSLLTKPLEDLWREAKCLTTLKDAAEQNPLLAGACERLQTQHAAALEAFTCACESLIIRCFMLREQFAIDTPASEPTVEPTSEPPASVEPTVAPPAPVEKLLPPKRRKKYVAKTVN